MKVTVVSEKTFTELQTALGANAEYKHVEYAPKMAMNALHVNGICLIPDFSAKTIVEQLFNVKENF